MLQMQLYANEGAGDLSKASTAALGIPGTIDWVSPRREDRYTEYRDKDFLVALGIEQYSDRLRSFWPNGGPCWDGLGLWTSPSGEVGPVLVEAKSYPEEAYSSMSAKSERSRQQIGHALDKTATRLGLISRPNTWIKGRYQTANRLAHLYFLREICGLPASLVFLLIVDDPTHNATLRGEWDSAWREMWAEMGLKQTPPDTSAVYLPGLPRGAT